MKAQLPDSEVTPEDNIGAGGIFNGVRVRQVQEESSMEDELDKSKRLYLAAVVIRRVRRMIFWWLLLFFCVNAVWCYLYFDMIQYMEKNAPGKLGLREQGWPEPVDRYLNFFVIWAVTVLLIWVLVKFRGVKKLKVLLAPLIPEIEQEIAPPIPNNTSPPPILNAEIKPEMSWLRLFVLSKKLLRDEGYPMGWFWGPDLSLFTPISPCPQEAREDKE